MLQILKAKLQTNQQELEETIKERDDLKQVLFFFWWPSRLNF